MPMMASLDHVNRSLKQVSRFLAPWLPLAGCHMVDYLTSNHWETLLSPQLQHDLLQLPKDKLQCLPSASFTFDDMDYTYSSEEWEASSSDLLSFMAAVQDHSLPSLGITTSLEEGSGLPGRPQGLFGPATLQSITIPHGIRKFAALAAVFSNMSWADIWARSFWQLNRVLAALYLVSVPGPSRRLQSVVSTLS
ncbi:uncharacterized protein [Procambarus clarkii]|uniref:uncharacterized protein n=1 Tax=Procambarus clarkii TaxID=6728 RepID=UPI003742A2CA